MADLEDDINCDRDLVTDDPHYCETINVSSHKMATGRLCDERFDSGINSYSSQSFLDFSLEGYVSLRRKTEFCEAIPELLSNKFTNISLEDEGISSLSLPAVVSTNSSSGNKKLQTTAKQIVIDFSKQDKDGDTFVNLALIGGNECLACALIDMVQNVECLNIPNFLYQRPLHLAVLTKQVKVLQKLLSKNIDISCQDHQGNTSLHLACRNGDLDCVKAILKVVRERRALQCLEVRNSEGLTCLHVAAKITENKMDIVRELIYSEANVNAVDAKSGRTILHYACERRDMELVRFLVKNTNIEIDFLTFDGKPAIYIAYWRNYQDIVKRLVKAGADFDYNVLNDVSEDSDDANV
ncbi:hypothetical protein CHS0354_038234 [Potamilus streckersoni]|uniref:Uncharacterized protein n=1 Tax=Potamilus streckersoni TaxID=2493646 RepID=A0AAE0W5Z7_9BIVA|nr:hypothetical protein CHS0354_038234 [Potamilus streckersoni]